MNALISLSRYSLMLPKPLSAHRFSALKTHPKAGLEEPQFITVAGWISPVHQHRQGPAVSRNVVWLPKDHRTR